MVRRDRPQIVIDCQLITSWITRSVPHISDAWAGTLGFIPGLGAGICFRPEPAGDAAD